MPHNHIAAAAGSCGGTGGGGIGGGGTGGGGTDEVFVNTMIHNNSILSEHCTAAATLPLLRPHTHTNPSQLLVTV